MNETNDPLSVFKYRSGSEDTFERDLKSLEENYFFAPNKDLLNDPNETTVYQDKFNKQTGCLARIFGVKSVRHLKRLNNSFENLVERKQEIGIFSLSRTSRDELLKE